MDSNCDGYVLIPAGTFTMGSPESRSRAAGTNEGPEHEVTLTGSFWLKTAEVTQGEWEALMGNNPSQTELRAATDCPVETVNWWESLAYCQRAQRRGRAWPACYTLSGCGDNDPGTEMECTGVTVNAPGEERVHL